MPVSCRLAGLMALSVLTWAGPTLAQSLPSTQSRSLAPSGGAAATLPNSFDAPARAPTPAPATAPTPPTAPTEVAVAEAALRVVIEQLRAGTIDARLYTPGLAARLRGQLPTITPMLNGYGDLLTIEAQGTRDGAGQFLVTFDEAATQWVIGLDEEGLIAALLFRPAPPESSEPATPPPA
ncbi:hypothetical protein Bresu_0043 [Brevundimonas subvibrioides ATCC 15264]|uniref:DUF3887 domain-containing protein n=2 Tax=Brevundimonas subvibrioides TaxID=74313 RepID=D9QHT3_BRESC|nr:hypothetical protein Bresu_0043 [Brevundimonas subvibrioides ATCC 15264]